jgi:hypothetical protein
MGEWGTKRLNKNDLQCVGMEKFSGRLLVILRIHEAQKLFATLFHLLIRGITLQFHLDLLAGNGGAGGVVVAARIAAAAAGGGR